MGTDPCGGAPWRNLRYVNMVGTDGMQLDYIGHSAAYDTWLNDIAGFEDYESGTRIVDLSIEKLHHFREVLPQWKEADEYTICDW